MIFPNETQDPKDVAEHYNSLDHWYRELWGEHLHHGLWKKGNEPSHLAVEQLVDLVAEKAQLQGGEKVCDIGCGYGATARMLTKKWDAKVTGFSLSERQLEYARSKDQRQTYMHCDWLQNSIPDASFDVAISIESSEHMPDKERFFREVHRILKPKGRIVVCAWLSKENPSPWEVRHFLEPICREGRLPSMGSVSDYVILMQSAGFEKIEYEDLTSEVKKTWAICGWRMLKELGNKEFRKFLFNKNSTERPFAKTVFRIFGAYQTRSMLYGIFSAAKNH